MERWLPYLGIVSGLILGVLGFLFSTRITLLPVPPAAFESTTTLSIVPPIQPPSFPTPSLPVEAIATTTPALAITAPPKKKIAQVTTAAPATAPAPAPPEDIPAELSISASALRAALVNILCYAPAGSGVTSISGSGVFIDPKGIIITNAHVAQYFLLADRGVSCSVRSGSPATDHYKASLIFISPAWISANAAVFTQSNPTGTGEHDLALLAVTRSVTTDALPSPFPYVPLATNPPMARAPIVIGSYGAQFLESNLIQSSLFPTLVYGSIKDVYTFAVNTIDVLALGGSAAAQEGSSGGGVVTTDGKLSGIITTSTIDGATATRQLDAITASYIRADYASESGEPLDLLLNQSLSASIASFSTQVQALESQLTAQLP